MVWVKVSETFVGGYLLLEHVVAQDVMIGACVTGHVVA